MEPENLDFAIQTRESAIRNSRFESCVTDLNHLEDLGVYTAVLQHQYGQFYTRTVLLGGRHDGLGGGHHGATQGLYKLPFPGQPVQAALEQA